MDSSSESGAYWIKLTADGDWMLAEWNARLRWWSYFGSDSTDDGWNYPAVIGPRVVAPALS